MEIKEWKELFEAAEMSYYDARKMLGESEPQGRLKEDEVKKALESNNSNLRFFAEHLVLKKMPGKYKLLLCLINSGNYTHRLEARTLLLKNFPDKLDEKTLRLLADSHPPSDITKKAKRLLINLCKKA